MSISDTRVVERGFHVNVNNNQSEESLKRNTRRIKRGRKIICIDQLYGWRGMDTGYYGEEESEEMPDFFDELKSRINALENEKENDELQALRQEAQERLKKTREAHPNFNILTDHPPTPNFSYTYIETSPSVTDESVDKCQSSQATISPTANSPVFVEKMEMRIAAGSNENVDSSGADELMEVDGSSYLRRNSDRQDENADITLQMDDDANLTYVVEKNDDEACKFVNSDENYAGSDEENEVPCLEIKLDGTFIVEKVTKNEDDSMIPVQNEQKEYRSVTIVGSGQIDNYSDFPVSNREKPLNEIMNTAEGNMLTTCHQDNVAAKTLPSHMEMSLSEIQEAVVNHQAKGGNAPIDDRFKSGMSPQLPSTKIHGCPAPLQTTFDLSRIEQSNLWNGATNELSPTNQRVSRILRSNLLAQMEGRTISSPAVPPCTKDRTILSFKTPKRRTGIAMEHANIERQPTNVTPLFRKRSVVPVGTRGTSTPVDESCCHVCPRYNAHHTAFASHATQTGFHTPKQAGPRTSTRTGSCTPLRTGLHTPKQTGSHTLTQTSPRAQTKAGSRTPVRTGPRTTPVQTGPRTSTGSRTPIRMGPRTTPVQTGPRTPIQSGSRTPMQTGSRAPVRTSLRTPVWTGFHTPMQIDFDTPTATRRRDVSQKKPVHHTLPRSRTPPAPVGKPSMLVDALTRIPLPTNALMAISQYGTPSPKPRALVDYELTPRRLSDEQLTPKLGHSTANVGNQSHNADSMGSRPMTRFAFEHIRRGGTPRPVSIKRRHWIAGSNVSLEQPRTPVQADISQMLVDDVMKSGPANRRRARRLPNDSRRNPPKMNNVKNLQPSPEQLNPMAKPTQDSPEITKEEMDETRHVIIDSFDGDEMGELVEVTQNLSIKEEQNVPLEEGKSILDATADEYRRKLSKCQASIFDASNYVGNRRILSMLNESSISVNTPGKENELTAIKMKSPLNGSSPDQLDNSTSPVHIVAAKDNKKKNAAVLCARKIVHSEETEQGLRRSARNRVAPVRHWLGEKPVYRRDEQGTYELVRVKEAVVSDPMFVRYKTIDMGQALERQKREQKQHVRARKLREFSRALRDYAEGNDVDTNE